jgi:branched-chain amino acid transport system substrate-binding protein
MGSCPNQPARPSDEADAITLTRFDRTAMLPAIGRETIMAGSFSRICACLALSAVFLAGAALAQPAPVTIGVLSSVNDYGADYSGAGSLVAAQMAVDDAGGTVLGRPIRVIQGDTQQKPDIAAALAAQWYDAQGVDVIVDLPQSAVGLAVQSVANKRNKILIASGVGTTLFAGKNCGPTTFQWVFDTNALASSLGRAVTATGGKSWFLLVADFAFGYDVERDATKVIEAGGGKVIGSVRHPGNATDMSSFVVRALGSGAQIIGFADAPPDNLNGVKAANDFGYRNNSQKLAPFLFQITDVHGLGLQAAQGLIVAEPFYWDLNEATRDFSRRFFAKTSRMPTQEQAGAYSSTQHYLRAVAAAGTTDGLEVSKRLHDLPVMGIYNGKVLPDGRMIHDFYVFRVKTPQESKAPWDYYTLLQTVPAAEAYAPESQSVCPLVKATP